MQQGQQAFDDIQFLTGSAQRREVLTALCEEPARPAELCADIDATRTTIQRILAGFRDRQWVVKHDGRYRTTITGQQVCTQYRNLLNTAEHARELGPLAAHLGPVADDIPVEPLKDGRLTVSEEGSPLATLSRFTDWMGGIDESLRAVSPVVARPFNDIGAELLASGTDIELVINTEVLERSRVQYRSDLELGVEHDEMDIYVQETPLPVGIAMDVERVCIVAYDDGNNMQAMLESTDGELYQWAADTYEQYREGAATLETVSSGEEVSAPKSRR